MESKTEREPQRRRWRNTPHHRIAVALATCAFALGSSTIGFAAVDPQATTEETAKRSTLDWITENFGVNYNSFFYGPGIGQPLDIPPAMNGGPADTGLNFWNLVSVKWKFSKRFAFDVQLRNQLVLTNQFEFRHQGQRFGVSGTFLKGEDWALAGALNSDLPVPGLMGQIPSERTLLVNPGLFGTFTWAPSSSRWSLFALLAPRMWFYRDRLALSQQDALGAGLAGKPEYTVYLNPSINYAVSDKVGLRFGTTLEFTKFVGFDSIRRNYMPFELGVEYKLSPKLNIYTYVWASTPLDDSLRASQGFANKSWADSLSVNLWLSGTLF
jgi:hypothetical protein